jgi:hypothetical protein
MKIASKVFIIISMVVLPLYHFYSLVNGLYGVSSDSVLYPAMVVISILMTLMVEIIGAIGLHKLKFARSKRELAAIGVLTIIFCSPVGGILMLCIPENDL